MCMSSLIVLGMDIKGQIQTRREALGLSKHGLSLKLGLSNDYIGKVEAGAWDPSLSTLRQLAEFFRAQGQPFSAEVEALLGLSASTAA